jgi:hypothetical protein
MLDQGSPRFANKRLRPSTCGRFFADIDKRAGIQPVH